MNHFKTSVLIFDKTKGLISAKHRSQAAKPLLLCFLCIPQCCRRQAAEKDIRGRIRVVVINRRAAQRIIRDRREVFSPAGQAAIHLGQDSFCRIPDLLIDVNGINIVVAIPAGGVPGTLRIGNSAV